MVDRVEVLEDLRMRIALLEQKFGDHERRHNEFMQRTDKSLDALIERSNEWTVALNEWAGIRKTLAVMASIVVTLAAGIGWGVHQFWSQAKP